MTDGVRRRQIALLLALVFLGSHAAAAGNVRFAVIADTHIGAGTASADLAAVVSRVNALAEVEFAVLVGDIAEKGRDSEFAEAGRLLSALKIPWRVVPGNHDSHWVGQGLIGFREVWPSDRFDFETAGRTFVGLNSWDFGHLAPDDLAWLGERVARTPAEGEIFVFVHHPPASVDNWFRAQNILRSRRTVVVSGHVHRTQVLDRAGLPVITVRRAMASPKGRPGFGLVECGPSGVSVFEVDGPEAPKLVGTVAAERLGAAAEIPPPVRTRDEVELLGRAELGTRVSLAPILAGGRIIVVDRVGRVHGFDSSGVERWVHDPKDLSASRPAGDDEFVYAATAKGRVLKLEAATGRLVAAGNAGERATSALALFPGRRGRTNLLAGTLSGRLVCLDGEGLEVLWTSSAAKDMIQSRPLPAGDKVVFGSWDARLHAVEAGTGRTVWTWTENDNFYYAPAGCEPATDGGRVFACSPDGFVSAVDLASGRTVWRERHNAWESLGLAQDRRRLLVKCRTDEFRTVEAATGLPAVRSSPAQGNGDIMPVEPIAWEDKAYFGALNGRVYEVDGGGRMKAVLDLGPAGVHSLLPLGGGRFAALNLDGTLVIFRVPRRLR